MHFAARAIEAVRSVAASEILPRYRSVGGTSAPANASRPRRKDDGSLVTEADLAAQEALVRALSAIDPGAVIAEEMPAHEQQAAYDRGGRVWVVDPLDGTANFAQGVPFFAVSVALLEDAQPVFGTVHDPLRDETCYAVRGAGAWFNHRPLLLPPGAPTLSGALVEVGLRREQSRRLRGPLKRRPPFRRRITSGSSTLSWCHLAAARIDALLVSNQKLWDYAAGALIAEEAGASLATVELDDFWSGPVWARSVIAARGAALLDEWKAWVRAELAAGDPEAGEASSSCRPR